METDILPLDEDESFDPMRFWNDRYSTQPDLARMALDALAVPAMSDKCERLFSSAKLLLTDRRSRLTPWQITTGPTDYKSWPDQLVIFGYVTPDLGLCVKTGHQNATSNSFSFRFIFQPRYFRYLGMYHNFVSKVRNNVKGTL
jgi:hypothetical protein